MKNNAIIISVRFTPFLFISPSLTPPLHLLACLPVCPAIHMFSYFFLQLATKGLIDSTST